MSDSSNTAPATTQTDESRQIRRVRHETKRRDLTVETIEALTPNMRRIVFRSPDLVDFVSGSPDDHIKVFLPGGDGSPVMRDYTPRRYDNAGTSLTIDFALHEAGPVTAWAMAAQVGDHLAIGGPRGSAIIPDVFDWYMLIGDETALPAIGRRLEELRPGVPVTVIGLVDNAAETQDFTSPANLSAHWVYRDVAGADDVASASAVIDKLFPAYGDGFVWLAAEAQVAKGLRAHILEVHKHTAQQMKAAGYWVRGDEGAHQPLD